MADDLEARREYRVALELHRALAAKLPTEHERIRAIGHRNIAKMLESQLSPIARSWVDQWAELLDGDPLQLKVAMLAPGLDAADMRQMAPFAGALTQEERIDAIQRANNVRS